MANELQQAIDEFIQKVRTITRREAIEAMQAVFAGDGATPARRGPGRPRKGPPIVATRAKGGKRDPKVLAALVSQLESEIKAKPGKRIEEIAKSLGIATDDLKLPARKLLAAKRIRKAGVKRATKYFAAK